MFENITLSQDEISVILGGMLGDAHQRNNKYKTLTFQQSKKQEEYLWWKKNILESISCDVCFSNENSLFPYVYFNTKSSGILLESFYEPLFKLTHEKNKKHINRKWLNMLTPLSLAVWWMDDGCLSVHDGNRYGKICSHSFSEKEHFIIKRYFKVVLDIDIQIKIEKQKYYFCRLNVENLKKLISIIYPYIITVPSMIYKIDLNYKNDVKLGNFAEVYNIIKSHRIS